MSEQPVTLRTIIAEIAFAIFAGSYAIYGLTSRDLDHGSQPSTVLIAALSIIFFSVMTFLSVRNVIRYIRQRDGARAREYRRAFEPIVQPTGYDGSSPAPPRAEVKCEDAEYRDGGGLSPPEDREA